MLEHELGREGDHQRGVVGEGGVNFQRCDGGFEAGVRASGDGEGEVFVEVGDPRGGELDVGGGRGFGFGFRGEEVSPALAFTAAGAELGVDGVGVAADVDDFLGGEDVDLDGQGRLGATGSRLEDTGGGIAVPGSDIRGDGEGGLRDGLGRQEIVLEEQDEGEFGRGFGPCGDVPDAHTEDLWGVVLLQETSGATASDGIMEGALGGFFGFDGST